jgi:uncharacterized protein Yka (UPF0111/DUF47 family)
VRRIFLEPFDRSDIRDLIFAMDDTIDRMHPTLRTTLPYEVRSFDPSMRRMRNIIVEGARSTREILPLLRSIGATAAKLHDFGNEIFRIQKRADRAHDQGLNGLFLSHRHDEPTVCIFGSALFRPLKKVVDGFARIANRMTGLVIGHL